MYLLKDYCCVCVCNKNNLKLLSDFDTDDITFYEKLISAVPEMCFNGMNNNRLTCEDCRNALKMVYEFRKKCLKSRTILIDYMSQEQTTGSDNSKTDNTNSTRTEKSDSLNETSSDNYNFINITEIKIEPDIECHEAAENDSLMKSLVKTEKDYSIEAAHLAQVIAQEAAATNEATTATSYELLRSKQDDQLSFRNFLKPYVCQLCQKRYTYPSQLKIHQRTHFRKKLHMCALCHRKFQHSAAYKAHMKSHKEDTPHACAHCDKRFVSQQQLDVHVRRHTGDPPFACEICSKAFRHMGTLTTHLRIHTGEKLFRCDVCDKKFTKKSDLSRHSRVHSGYKPHECPVCGKKFSRSDHLVKHTKTHANAAYVCGYCSKRFAHSDSLASHLLCHIDDTL